MPHPATLVGHVKLGPSQLKRTEMVRQLYTIIADSGVTFEHILQPEYWSNHCTGPRALRVGDQIDVVLADGSQWALLRVMSVMTQAARVAILHKVVFDEKESNQEEPDDEFDAFTIRHTPGDLKWWVCRKSDNKRILKGSLSKVEAQNALRDYLAALRR